MQFRSAEVLMQIAPQGIDLGYLAAPLGTSLDTI